MKKSVLILGALALASAPLAAQSAPAIAPVEAGAELGGGAEAVIIVGLIAGIVAIGVLAATDDDDLPASP
ncbi:MAG: hypothetical protein AAF494_13640 [Pseudomonadota bacterium]